MYARTHMLLTGVAARDSCPFAMSTGETKEQLSNDSNGHGQGRQNLLVLEI